MSFLPVPKLMCWKPSLSQQYVTDKKILVTSGCSFTSSTNQLETAASWPGFVMDRCRFDQCIDYSYPASGNEYIGDSILHFFSKVPDHELDQYMAIVMWSGLGRKHIKHSGNEQPNLNGISYKRIMDLSTIDLKEKKIRALESANKILEVYNYLVKRNIQFAFTFYCNLLFPPYLPKRDMAYEFDNMISPDLLTKVRDLPWIPNNSMEFLYEYAFVNDLLDSVDLFHPRVECNLKWTDEILLPELANQNFIKSL